MRSLNQEVGHPKESIVISVICTVSEVPRKLVKINKQILLYPERNLMDRVQPLGIIQSSLFKRKREIQQLYIKSKHHIKTLNSEKLKKKILVEGHNQRREA